MLRWQGRLFVLTREWCTDGEAWQHSRALVRPAFTKSQVADLSLFESHVAPLLQQMPRDGTTVDLGPHFFQLTAGKLSPGKPHQTVNVDRASKYINRID